MLLQSLLFFHDGFKQSCSAILHNTALWLMTTAAFTIFTLTNTVQETDHLLQVLFCIHGRTTVTTLCRESRFRLHTCSLQQLIKFLSLAARYDIVFLAMEYDNRWILFVHILSSTETKVLIRFLVKFGIQQHILGGVLTHRHVLTTVHRRQVNRTRPVTGSIHHAALVGIVADGTF